MSDDQRRLGKFEVIRTLGQGAMGVVYEGLDRVIERRVAIKTVRTADLDADEAEEHRRRFLIEARAAGKLNHPHIVSLYDHGEQDGTAYLVMELVIGHELQQWFDDGRRFTFAETLRLMDELLDALGYSHRQGVIHRDVKPANIFITESGILKLGDFGIARIESAQRTRAGLAIGTPTHMAPEQIRGETADARADLYAAGVVLFQLLTGSRPFSGTMLTMALKVLNEPAPLPSAVNPQVTPALDAVVTKALAKAVDDRYQSAEAFREALTQALRQAIELASPPQPATIVMPVAGGRSSPAVATGGANSTPSSATSAGPGSRLPVWLAAACALAAVIGAAAWWSGSGRPAAPPLPSSAPEAAKTLDSTRPPSTAASAAAASPAATPARSGTPDKAAADLARRSDERVTAMPASPLPPPPAEAGSPTALARPDAGRPATGGQPARSSGPDAAPAAPPDERAARSAAPREVAAPPPAPTRVATPSAPAAAGALPVECSDILLKASLEPLTIEESRYLRRECQ